MQKSLKNHQNVRKSQNFEIGAVQKSGNLVELESRKSKVESRMWSEKRLKPCQKSLQRLSDLALVIEMKRGKLGQSDMRETDGANRCYLCTCW